MKKILIMLIKLYKRVPGNFHNYCRFTPSCSTYALISIERYGALKGTVMSIKRIIRCNPFGKYGYDPVPERGKKWKEF